MASPEAQANFVRGRARSARLFFVLVNLAFLLCSCAAASRTTDPNRPRGDETPYPIVLEPSTERREKALAAWSVLVGEQAPAATPTPELRPVTATIASLPESLTAPLRLPKVITGDAQNQTPEETQESLRRFIERAASLLGLERRTATTITETERESTLGDLSLVDIGDDKAGAKRARYLQNPFELPLRNGFGEIEVGFTSDLRVTALSSSAIPGTDSLRRSVATLRQGVKDDKLASSLMNRTFTFTDQNGNQQTRTVTKVEEVTVRDLVVFPRVHGSDGSKLEIRLAWELSIGDQDPPLLVFVDAVTGEQLTR